MSDEERPVMNPLLVLREEFDDWAVLFDPDTGNAFGMNPTSIFVWKHLDGKHTARDIEGKLRANYDDVSDEVSVHIQEFISDLKDRGYAVC